MKKALFLLSIVYISVGVLTVVPLSQVHAATYVVDLSQFSTQQEKINHLRGILAVLQAQLAAKQADQNDTDSFRVNSTTERNALAVATLSAQDIRESKANIRGRFDMEDEDFVMVWFEFGETRELYERTQQVRIEGGQEETRIHSHLLENLKDDKTYYYRLAVETERGVRSYGTVRSFRTVDENRAYIVRARDTRLKIGETITVDWFLPAKAINGSNWIGIFEVDSPHSISAAYSWANTETGSLSLYAGEEQDYEARLFTDDSYNLVAVSELITVSD